MISPFAVPILISMATITSQTSERPQLRKITSARAMKIIQTLPEIKNWTTFIAKNSHGVKHGGLVLFSAENEPDEIDGVHYWDIRFLEFDKADGIPAHRWETFLVRVTNGEVFIADHVTEENGVDPSVISLKEWRILIKKNRSKK